MGDSSLTMSEPFGITVSSILIVLLCDVLTVQQCVMCKCTLCNIERQLTMPSHPFHLLLYPIHFIRRI